MRKLYKSSKDKKIAGVCGGLAEYFGIDPIGLRAIFAISFFIFGTGLLPYLILAIIMPNDYEMGRPSSFNSTNSSYRSKQTGVYMNRQQANSHIKDVTDSADTRDDEWNEF